MSLQEKGKRKFKTIFNSFHCLYVFPQFLTPIADTLVGNLLAEPVSKTPPLSVEKIEHQIGRYLFYGTGHTAQDISVAIHLSIHPKIPLVQLLHCQGLFIGFESINRASLEGVHKVQNSVDKYERAVEEIHRRGIMINASFVSYDLQICLIEVIF